MRNRSVVFYGASNHGKSTLAGHIFSKTTLAQKDMETFERAFKREFGSQYDQSHFYAWLINSDYYEQREVFNSFTGASEMKYVFRETAETRRLHERQIPLEINGSIEYINIFDTPGQIDKRERAAEREKGLVWGDIGVFCVEIGEVLKDEFDEEHFATYEVWSKVNASGAAPVIALTKLDYFPSEKDYASASDKIRIYGGYDEAVIVPVAVLVSERKSINVLEKAAETPWYSGPALIDAISARV